MGHWRRHQLWSTDYGFVQRVIGLIMSFIVCIQIVRVTFIVACSQDVAYNIASDTSVGRTKTKIELLFYTRLCHENIQKFPEFRSHHALVRVFCFFGEKIIPRYQECIRSIDGTAEEYLISDDTRHPRNEANSHRLPTFAVISTC